MNIAFLTSEYPDPNVSHSAGIGTSIYNIAQGLIGLGNSVHVIVYGQNKDEVFNSNGVVVHKIKNIKLKGFSFLLTQLKVSRRINALYLKGEIDIVEVPDWTGFGAFLNIKCPMVIKLHGSDTYFCHLEGRRVKWLNKFLERRALKKANGVISVSQFTGALTMSLFRLRRSFEVIPNAIDVSQFTPDPSLVQQNLILYFGTLIRKKGVLEIPYIFNEIMKSQPKAQLLLIGKDAKDISTGKSSTWVLMNDLFDENAKKNVSFIGAVPYENIKDYIQNAHVCIFPSYAEAFPVSWMEAMVLGKSIVTSDIGWTHELLEDEITGFTVHPNKHRLFASRVVELLTNDNLNETIGVHARELILNKYSTRTISMSNLNYYRLILDRAVC